MDEEKYEVTIEMEKMDCPTCGMFFFLPKNFVSKRRKDGNTFHCAMGHAIVFAKAKDDVEQLNEENQQLKKEVQNLKTDKLNLVHKLEQSGHI